MGLYLKSCSLTVLSALFCLNSFSQNIDYETIALRASRTYFGGTARVMGMGGAYGALGADIASLTSNPAGLAAYKSGDFSITPSLVSTETHSSFSGTEASDNKNRVTFNGFGLVSSFGGDDARVNFAFGINRLADFHSQTPIAGSNLALSMTDGFASEANNFRGPGVGIHYRTLDSDSPNQGNIGSWSIIEAWETGLIGREEFPDGSLASNSYTSILAPGELVNQEFSIEEKGYINQYDFAMAYHFDKIVDFGITLGVQEFSYSSKRFSTEHFFQESPTAGFERYEYLDIDGAGINIRLGAIFPITQALRLGLAVQTPTWYSLDEDYFVETTSSVAIESGDIFPGDDEHIVLGHSSPFAPSEVSYRLRTPFRFTPSLAYVTNVLKLSVDYEYADYANIHFSNPDYEYDSQLTEGRFDESNESIDNLYTGSHTLRAGLEAKLHSTFLLRAGYAFYSSPVSTKAIAEGAGDPGDSKFYTLGFGIRGRGGSYLDFAYIYNHLDYDNYHVHSGATADLEQNKQTFVLTFGIRY